MSCQQRLVELGRLSPNESWCNAHLRCPCHPHASRLASKLIYRNGSMGSTYVEIGFVVTEQKIASAQGFIVSSISSPARPPPSKEIYKTCKRTGSRCAKNALLPAGPGRPSVRHSIRIRLSIQPSSCVVYAAAVYLDSNFVSTCKLHLISNALSC